MDCKKHFVLNKFEDHIFTEHLKEALYRFDADSMKKERQSWVQKSDRIAKAGNAHGDFARVGESGKFYCGNSIEACNKCCDGHCGPNNGCNCRACMFIDTEARHLPPGFLVNRLGRACRVSKSSGKVHCGGMISEYGREYCDDTSRKQCPGCERIQDQMGTIYAGINEFGVVKY